MLDSEYYLVIVRGRVRQNHCLDNFNIYCKDSNFVQYHCLDNFNIYCKDNNFVQYHCLDNFNIYCLYWELSSRLLYFIEIFSINWQE